MARPAKSCQGTTPTKKFLANTGLPILPPTLIIVPLTEPTLDNQSQIPREINQNRRSRERDEEPPLSRLS